MSVFIACSAYNEIWHRTNVELDSLLETELPKEKPKPEEVGIPTADTHAYNTLIFSLMPYIGQTCSIPKVCYDVCKICCYLQETGRML